MMRNYCSFLKRETDQEYKQKSAFAKKLSTKDIKVYFYVYFCHSRSVNYEKSRLSFDRWEALVRSNRAAPQLIFPLNSTEKLKIIEQRAEKYPSTRRIKSDLQKELEKLDPKVMEYHINQAEDQFPLTLEELKECRSEAAKLRAHQSYKEAEARQQNKIKSKKYHRILKREIIMIKSP